MCGWGRDGAAREHERILYTVWAIWLFLRERYYIANMSYTIQ